MADDQNTMWLIRLSSDLTTKVRHTRRRFQARLVGNLKDALASNEIDFKLHTEWSRLYLESNDPRVPDVLQSVFAIHSFSLTHVYPVSTLYDLVAQGVALYHERVQGKTYAVRARRAGDAPFSSMDVNQHLGAALNEGATVDLSNPQVTVHVEVRQGRVFFFSDLLPGPGGLPLGTEGRALALMSGGFDSAVAAWMLLKRGVMLDYAFFRLGGPSHERDVNNVAAVLARQWSYGTQPRMVVVPFERVVEQIQDCTPPRYWQLMLKRQMYRAALAVAWRIKVGALVTGEALGQVSSQTLPNLEALNITGAVPVLRPLIGFDKNDIVRKAYAIGTGAISAHVPEYCALQAKRPATKATFAELNGVEAALRVDQQALAADAKVVRLRQDKWTAPAAEVADHLPDLENVVLLDIRTQSEFRRGHAPSAQHLDFAHALDGFEKLDKRKHYYVFCNAGLKSANLVDRMRQKGYTACVYRPNDVPEGLDSA